MQPSAIIPAFDAYLAAGGLHFDATIIDGSALVLLDVVTRTTDDCDVLDPEIPAAIQDAARAFAAESGIGSEWLNSRAHDFVGVVGCLPNGWRARLRSVYRGQALHFDTLGAFDLLCTKLVALIDRGTDFADCVALAPTLADLQAAWPFIEQYEGNRESREQFWIPLARRQPQPTCRGARSRCRFLESNQRAPRVTGSTPPCAASARASVVARRTVHRPISKRRSSRRWRGRCRATSERWACFWRGSPSTKRV